MIISASRRTDIPGLYADWFMNRVREGWCHVPNPFNSNQISEISLSPADVDAIVFWTKNPRPIFKHLDEIDQRGFLYYFLVTLNDYPATIEPGVPERAARVEAFVRLAERLGNKRVVWRYDPIIISTATPYGYHEERFGELCRFLSGSTRRVIVSLVDYYKKTERRLSEIESGGLAFDRDAAARPETRDLLSRMSRVAGEHGMEIQSCAHAEGFEDVGVPAGSCIDGELIRRIGGNVHPGKDRGQRDACRCVESRDIGINDTCIHGCLYCYATRDHNLASKRHAEHDNTAATLWERG